MPFRITRLSPEPFSHLFGLPDEELACHGAQRYRAEADSAFPDRIEISDARPGETVLLVNFTHQPGDTPYRSSHAIFVRERDVEPTDMVDDIPQAMRVRPLSLRGFDSGHRMIEADLVEGSDATPLIERFFANPGVAYIQAHYAKRGCYAGRVERA